MLFISYPGIDSLKKINFFSLISSVCYAICVELGWRKSGLEEL